MTCYEVVVLSDNFSVKRKPQSSEENICFLHKLALTVVLVVSGSRHLIHVWERQVSSWDDATVCFAIFLDNVKQFFFCSGQMNAMTSNFENTGFVNL